MIHTRPAPGERAAEAIQAYVEPGGGDERRGRGSTGAGAGPPGRACAGGAAGAAGGVVRLERGEAVAGPAAAWPAGAGAGPGDLGHRLLGDGPGPGHVRDRKSTRLNSI